MNIITINYIAIICILLMAVSAVIFIARKDKQEERSFEQEMTEAEMQPDRQRESNAA